MATKAPKIDPVLIEEARKKRLHEMKIWDVIKELIFYSLYLMIVVSLSFGDQDSNGIYMHNHIMSAFAGGDRGQMPFKDVIIVGIILNSTFEKLC